jgi:CNT family concentrative nucleoside transporter
MGYYNLISLAGILVIILVAWIFSKNPRRVSWRVVFWSVALQFIFAGFIFKLPAGLGLFRFLNEAVLKVLSFAREGAYFLFGPLAVPPGSRGPSGEESLGFILAIQVLSTIIFFSSLMALLYHAGIMQKVVRLFARIFTCLMKISGAESLCAASNIFVGIESALTVRPYIQNMTNSELCTILTAGMATIASTVLGLYVSLLHTQFPTIAGHLISASILSAPAAVAMSKLLFPETEIPKTAGKLVREEYKKSSSWVESVIQGANDGLRLCGGIVALLLAFLGLLALFDWMLGIIGQGVGNLLNLQLELSFQKLLSYLFYPFSLVMGVPGEDAFKVATLLGERSLVTELVSYQRLSEFVRAGQLVHQRSVVIATYALCGFAHVASLAIFVGGISAIAPGRARDLAKLGFRALVAASLACLMTGAVAGLFFVPGQEAILGLK